MSQLEVFSVLYSLTYGGILGQHSDIFPWGGVPIGVIISLLGTLVTVAVSIGVLTCIDGATDSQSIVVLEILVSGEESFRQRLTHK